MRKLAVLSLLIALFASSCSSSGPATIGAGPTPEAPGDDDPVVVTDDFVLTASLVPFDACASFLDHVHAEAAKRVGPYGIDGYGGGPVIMEGEIAIDVMSDEAMAEVAPVEEPASPPRGAPAPSADDAASNIGPDQATEGTVFSETNVQETGVDEPDIVKTDGRRIVTISNNVITVVDVTGEPTEIGKVRLEGGWAREAFLAGDKLVLISDGDGGFAVPYPLEDSVSREVEPSGDDDAEAGFAPEETEPAPPIVEAPYFENWRETTKVTTIDLAGAPTVTDVLEMEGRYLSARAVDGTARVVLTSRPDDLPFLYPQNPSGEERAAEANRDIVNESTVNQWVPDFQRRNAGGTVLDEGQLVPCDRIHRPEAFAGFEMLTVVGLDLLADDVVPTDATGVLASGETVYASTESLYVATNRWFDTFPVEAGAERIVEERYTTSVHKFSLTDGGGAEYQASGAVDGHLLNQFSLDEADGYLRVATTAGSPWGGGPDAESFIAVLEQSGGALTEVGKVGGLGKGERIFSVRFMDDVAYVVTFRQVDPFYVVDLSSPTDPTVVGELKIPGYSSYLHPIGDDLVLGVGQDADENGRTLGAKVSLFDVSNRADPVELAVWTGGGESYTDAEWDHRAFTWWGPENLAILPLSSYGDQFFGAVVLEVTRDGIVERGRVDQADDAITGATECVPVEPAQRATSYDDARTELDYVLLEGGKVVVCEPDQAVGNPVEGMSCEGPILVSEAFDYFGIGEDEIISTLTEPVPVDGHLFFCWPDYYGGDPVVRTLIVDDDLFTMSYRWLQSNDLASLELLARIAID